MRLLCRSVGTIVVIAIRVGLVSLVITTVRAVVRGVDVVGTNVG